MYVLNESSQVTKVFFMVYVIPLLSPLPLYVDLSYIVWAAARCSPRTASWVKIPKAATKKTNPARGTMMCP